MAKDNSPIGKQSRREGFALHPKAHKLLVKKPYVPGHTVKDDALESVSMANSSEKNKRLEGLTAF
jgi:hypothetical protein